MKLKSKLSKFLGCGGVMLLLLVVFTIVSVSSGGHMPGPVYVSPGNVGVVVNTYSGKIAESLLPAGLHWQGMFDVVYEVHTQQRTVSFEHNSKSEADSAIAVNTASNMVTVDATAQYNIRADLAKALYADFRDSFSNMEDFENRQIRPAIIEAINYAVGDLDTADAMTSAGKTRAEAEALKYLQEEWGPKGVEFRSLFLRSVDLDEETKNVLNQTTTKLQEIENAKLALKQQKVDNQTTINNAKAEARINRAQDASLTDLYVQDKLLERVDTIYMPSDEIMGMIKK